MARYNYRLAKIHRSYTVYELAEVFRVHKQTIRSWIHDGLSVCNSTRPILIRGIDVRDYLVGKNAKNKRPCELGQIYCVACKQPRRPKDGHVILKCQNDRVGDLVGECPGCGTNMHRKVSLPKIDDWRSILTITDMRGK